MRGTTRHGLKTPPLLQKSTRVLGAMAEFGGDVKSVAWLGGSMAARRTAEAVWEHDLIHGNGHVKGTSGALPDVPVSWAARTEAPGGKTSPEELLAAAHAACYSMALSAGLARMQKPPQRLEVSATATFDKVGDAWKVTTMELSVVGNVPGISAADFAAAAKAASEGCPISGALKGNVAISVQARLA
jgi:lipoyl-dependent peroxiredoxin